MENSFGPIFSGGSGRSGTTAIVNLLNHHPKILTSRPRELRYLTDRAGLLDLNFSRPLYYEVSFTELRNRYALTAYKLIGRTSQKVFINRISNRWWSQIGKKGNIRGLVQGVSKEQLEGALKIYRSNRKHNLLTASRELFFTLSSNQFDKESVEYFLDSTPLNIQNAHRIIKLLPSARFINMVRDGRDVALSVSKEKWGPSTAEQGLAWWGKRIELAHKGLATISRDAQLTIRLEKLITYNRSATLANVLEFIGVENNPKLLEKFDSDFSEDKMSIGKWKSEVKNPVKFEKDYFKILSQLSDKGIEIERFY